MTGPSDKIDARSRRALEAMSQDASIEALVRTRRAATLEQIASLRTIGVEVISHVGPILSVRMPCSAVPALAMLDFVRSVQLSRELHPERGG